MAGNYYSDVNWVKQIDMHVMDVCMDVRKYTYILRHEIERYTLKEHVHECFF